MSVRILAAASPGEVRIAAACGDELLDYAIWRPGSPDGIGDLYRGRVLSRVPAMAGAFVSLGGPDGFLPDSAGGASVSVGDLLVVRVTRAAQGGKGPRLTAQLTPDEAKLTAGGGKGLLARGEGALLELAARFPDASLHVDSPAWAVQLKPRLGERLQVIRRAFDEPIEAAIDALAEPEVDLPGGARLRIYPTPALVAIDIDTGGEVAKQSGKSASHLAVNQALMPTLARQIRLRNLSGAIVIDFAGLSARRRAALGPALTAALAKDPLRPRLLGFTALGLAEIVRARVRPPLHELLAGPHATGLMALRRIAAELAAAPHRAILLRTSPAIVAALQNDAVALPDLASLTGRDMILQTDPNLPITGWSIETSDAG